MGDLSIQDPAFCFGIYLFDPLSKLGYLYVAVAKTNESLAEFAGSKRSSTEIASPLTVVDRTLNGIRGLEF